MGTLREERMAEEDYEHEHQRLGAERQQRELANDTAALTAQIDSLQRELRDKQEEMALAQREYAAHERRLRRQRALRQQLRGEDIPATTTDGEGGSMARKRPNNPPEPAAYGRHARTARNTAAAEAVYRRQQSISLQAIGNLTATLHTLPSTCYQLDIIDALDDPMRAVRDGILVTPTLLKLAPSPSVSLLGDMRDEQQFCDCWASWRRTHERSQASAD